MKAIGLLCLLLPSVTLASVGPTTPVSNSTVYTCHALTDNEVDPKAENFEQGLLTDAPIQNVITEVTRSETGYSIKKNEIFPEDVVMTNPEMKQLGNFASNPSTMLFKKRSDNGLPYFIVLGTKNPAKPGEKPADNPITRLVTIAQCEH